MNMDRATFLRTQRGALAVCLLLGTAVLPLRAEPRQDTWPQWRGPTRDGHIAGTAWPESLQGDRLERLWRVELGASYSGPVVAEDRVFVTETQDKNFEAVRALDRDTGKELWRFRWKSSYKAPSYARAHGDWIRSTPAYDGDSLYVAGMQDVLFCLDARTGEERWRVDFVKQFQTPLPVFGFVSSPLVDGEAVYVQAAAAVVKLNKKMGAVVWRSFPDERGPNGSAVSSPVLAQLAGQRQLLVQNRRQLGGLDPEDGKVLWTEEVPAFNSMNTLTPVVYQDDVFTSAYGGRSFLFHLARQGDRVKAVTAWTNKAQGYLSTPVVIDGYLYLHLRNQRLTCLELKTGKECWTTAKTFGPYWSLVANGDRILALDQRGILYLVHATPEKFDLLDSRKVSDAETWAHLAVAGDQLFVRERNALTVFRWRQPSK